jgi:hypothetical protein
VKIADPSATISAAAVRIGHASRPGIQAGRHRADALVAGSTAAVEIALARSAAHTAAGIGIRSAGRADEGHRATAQEHGQSGEALQRGHSSAGAHGLLTSNRRLIDERLVQTMRKLRSKEPRGGDRSGAFSKLGQRDHLERLSFLDKSSAGKPLLCRCQNL